jgi:peroxiredoxin
MMIKRLLTLLTSAALLSLGACAQGGATDGYQVGEQVSDFELRNVDGDLVSMADYPEAKGFIVVFTCNHCPYAKKYEQRIIELAEEFNPQGYPVIAIQPNDPEAYPADNMANMKARAEEKSYPFPYVMDETQGVARVYGATRTPETRVIERLSSGDLLLRYRGAIDDNYQDASAVEQRYTAEAVEALLSGDEVATPAAKAIGCSIKWKDS